MTPVPLEFISGAAAFVFAVFIVFVVIPSGFRALRRRVQERRQAKAIRENYLRQKEFKKRSDSDGS